MAPNRQESVANIFKFYRVLAKDDKNLDKGFFDGFY
jgi:hypothetical protein